jgi:inosose dehydratase
LKIGNAPVSWGIFELEGISADLPYRRVMDEIAASGYEGTELGPWGYFPTDPSQLREELSKRGLQLASAFCPVDLTAPSRYAEAEAQTLATAHLLRTLGTTKLILADPWRPVRATVAGRADGSDELSPAGWDAVVAGLNRLGSRLADDGMKAVFHHHVATYVETEAEINRLLDLTDPRFVGLCLDTGHAAFGGADPVRLLRRWRDRVHYVHLKDVSPSVLARIPIDRLGYDALIRAGIFCPLGEGQIDFPAIAAELRAANYDGWLIVEQDVIVGGSGQRATSLEAARQSRAFLRELLGN